MKIILCYAEKPGTRDEREIGDVFEKMLRALQIGDFETFSCYLSSIASMEVTQKSERYIMNKTDYIDFQKKNISAFREIECRDVIVRVQSTSEADLFCSMRLLSFVRVWSEMDMRQFKFKKENTMWRVVQSRYIQQ